MATKGLVLLSDIFEMLNECAPGFDVAEGPHHYRVKWNGRTYPTLPKGEHGKRPGRGSVQKGKVRDLVAFFGIEECAKGRLEILR